MLVAAFIAVFALPLDARTQAPSALEGRIIDTQGHALPDALVSVVGTLWEARSRPNGTFRLALPAGRWQLSVRRVGFQRLTHTVTISATGRPEPVRLMLSSASAELRGVTVTGDRQMPMASTVTRQTVRNVPPLGEADIFRLLPLLGSVSQPNDLIGRIHLAGGASDENAVYLNGHPLQSPFHVLSVLGAFNVAALDRADVLIHHLPSRIDGRVSGAIDLASREASERPAREVDVSLLSATATATQPSLLKGVRALASGRITYLDRLVGAYARRSGSTDDIAVPAFRDGILTLDRSWKSGWSAQLLQYGTADAWSGYRGPRSIPPQWGEHLLGTRVGFDDSRWRVGLRLSTDNATVLFRRPNDAVIAGVLRPIDDAIDVRQRWTSGDIHLDRLGRSWRVGGGLTVDVRHHSDDWSGNEVQDWFSAHLPLNYHVQRSQTLGGAFLEASFLATERWTATAGAHLSSLAGRDYLAPRFASSLRLTDAWRLEFAADRRFQFDAIAEEPKEGSITQPTFLLQTPRMADILSLSANWRELETPDTAKRAVRVGGALTVYARRDRDRTLLRPETPANGSPQADPLLGDGSDFPLFERVPGRTLGASATADLRIVGGTIVQGSYTLQRVRERVDNAWRPTAWDVPQSLSLFAGVPVSSHWMLTGAAQFRTGSAITPVTARLFVPLGDGQYVPRFIYGHVNSARVPAYQRIDMGARYSWTARGANWTMSFQVLNVLNRENALDRDWLSYFGCVRQGTCSASGASRHGLPILPSIGLQVQW